MNIQPLGAATPSSSPVSSPPPAPAAGSPTDRFLSSAPSEDPDKLRRAAKALTKQGELRKSESKYRPAAWTVGPGGTLYVGYSEGWEGKKSYLASVQPDGRISWELPLGEARISHVGLAPDGSLQVGTEDGHLVCSAEGRLVEERTGGPEVRSHHQDSTGMHLEVLSQDSRMIVLGPDGAELPLPKDLEGIRARAVQSTPEGGLVIFSDDKVVRLAPGGATAVSTPLPPWPADGKTSFGAHRAWALEGGDVLVQRNSYLDITPRGPHRFMMPGGMRGGHFDPDAWAPQTITRTAFVRLSADGTELWKTGEFGEETRPVVIPNGTVLFHDGGSKVRRVTPQGSVEEAFDVAGRIEDFRPGARPGTVLVKHADHVTRFDADGASQGDVAIPAERRSWSFEGDLEDGRILFREGSKGVLWSADQATGSWTRLTDPEIDHSLRPEDLVSTEPPAEAGRVEEGDGWVIIGDVQLPRK